MSRKTSSAPVGPLLVVGALLMTGVVSADQPQENEPQSDTAQAEWISPPVDNNPAERLGYRRFRDLVNEPPPWDSQAELLLFSGRVLLASGGVAYEPIPIVRVCGGVPVPEGVTDLEGRFTIRPGRELERGIDPSLPTGYPPDNLWGCELRAELLGFRSEAVPVGTARAPSTHDIGTIVLHPIEGFVGSGVSATSRLVSHQARRAYTRGLRAVSRGEIDDAREQFEKAVLIDARYASAWTALGELHHRSGNVERALAAYDQAIEVDARFVPPYRGMYLLAAQDRNWQRLADLTARVNRLAPGALADAFYLNAVANLELGRLTLAEQSARTAVELGWADRDPRATELLATILQRTH